MLINKDARCSLLYRMFQRQPLLVSMRDLGFLGGEGLALLCSPAFQGTDCDRCS
jgi:hypothetical protein